MRKIPYSLGIISVLLIVLTTACSSAAQPTTAAPSVPQPASGAAVQPAQPAAPAAAQPSGGGTAPICQGATSCQAPTADQAQISCVKKVPYTNVSVPPGTIFEVLDKSGNFTCVDSSTVVNGKEVITCHGTELYTFDLKLTSTTCGGASLTTGGGQCQQGYGYDAAQQCCAPTTGGSNNSTTVTVALGACPLPSP
jgi:hypothetical protein